MFEDQIVRAELRIATSDLRGDLAFFGKTLRFRLDRIWPADDPACAVLSGHGLRLRLEQGTDAPAGALYLLTDDRAFAGGARDLTAPGGATVAIRPLDPPLDLPATRHEYAVRHLADGAPWVIGRAGMLYRDLVPSRLGGAIIASHIRIPDGGPVPDMVHFHKVGFQLIFCIAGWVDVVYEDQGPPIRLTPGDCVIQPPEIRHRVLHASDGIEVIEIGVPAEHVTEIDHVLTLPTPDLRPDRTWAGQRFVHNRAADAVWGPHRLAGYMARDTGIAAGTNNVAGVQVVRKGQGDPAMATHDVDILFGFVMSGALTLTAEGHPPDRLLTGDAFVLPPGLPALLADATDDVEWLEVALPGLSPA